MPRLPTTSRFRACLLGVALALAAQLCGAQSAPTSDAPNAAPPMSPGAPGVADPQFGPPAPAAPPALRGPSIALVLPLEAPAYARVADAVRAGFMAAAAAAGMTARCEVIGPLARDDQTTLAIAGGEWPNTVALNQLDDGSPLPPNTWSLALSGESDARVLARAAMRDGVKAIDIVE